MSNYKQSDVAGTYWQRCCRMVVDNPAAGVPSVTCMEEAVVNLADSVITKSIPGNLIEQFVQSNYSEPFDIIDPVTGTPTGDTSTYMAVYVMLYSLYFHMAKKRDALALEKMATDEIVIGQ